MERSIPKYKSGRGGMADIRVRRSTQQLRDALLKLLQSQSFDDITVRDIAALADVGYTTFFRHYSSKEALLDALISDEVARMAERATPIFDAADHYGACLAFCEYVDENWLLWTSLLTGGAALRVREELLAQSRTMASTRLRDGGLPPDLGTAMAVAVIIELIAWWLRQPEPWSVEKVASILHSRVIKPNQEPI